MYCYYFKEARGKTIDMSSTSAIRSAKTAESGESNSNPSGGSASSGKENQTTNVVAKKDKPVRQRTALYSENLPTFYVGAGNNSEL